ncbi:MAG: hypothetical protein QNJ57_07830 [Flavobacteriaceae bacterium]|nr:hypothetical protein [Flavobacteriaceae bacterium]
MALFRTYTLSLLLLMIFSCQKTKKEDSIARTSEQCVTYILKKDDSLGTIRNHSCEKISLSTTIQQYTSSLNELDFSNCPEDFSKAFKDHISAWNEMTAITDRHDQLRGEMHDLFDIIEKSLDSTEFAARLKAIWDTWEPIEKAKNIK